MNDLKEITHLYMISHCELPPLHQAIQATHAALGVAHLVNPDKIHLVHLTCPSKEDLKELRNKLQSHEVEVYSFHEPYDDWELTAISCALDSTKRHLLASLPLWTL